MDMMKKILKNCFFTILLAFSIMAQGQSEDTKLEKANNSFDGLSYIDAREAYIKVHEKGFKSSDLYEKLGDSYYFNADYNNAERWYSELYRLDGEYTKPEYLYRYALTLKTLKNYGKSDAMMELFNSKQYGDNRADLFVNERNYLSEINGNSGRFVIKNEDFNSKLSDYGPSYYGDQIIISTNRDEGRVSKRVHSWNDQPFSDLYTVSVSEENETADIKNFNKNINTKFHESTSLFTKDGNTVYFTRNNFTDNVRVDDTKGTNRLKLYKGTKDGEDEWTVTELPFNSNDYSVAHPALNSAEDVLYFASDMKGGYGESDLYMVTIDGDTYGEPVNLGKGINSEGRETFPFVSGDNRFYFASNGHPGLGGLDVFVSEMYTDSDFSDVYNVGKPVNGEFDDFTFIINDKTKKGYFASNRTEGKGDDDIYSFIENKPLVISFKQKLEGTVLNETTNKPVPNVKVSLLNADGNVIAEQITDENGEYKFDLEQSKQYSIRYEKDDFKTREKTFKSSDENGKVYKELEVIQEGKDLIGPVAVNVGDDLTKILSLKPIYFDLDKSYIRQDAEIELQKVIVILELYSTMKLDVRSHTDSRADDDYNLALSDRRNKATIAYLVSKGISSDRLTGKGYGETRLANKCSNGVPCNEGLHQLNRRSEFIILSK